jgi:ABC-type ATPase involved in cell division
MQPRALPPTESESQVRRSSYFRNRNDNGSKPLLVLEDVYKYFRRDIPTLRAVNLTVERGEFVFVTGPSGAGKSTLLQLVYRQYQVDGGRICFSGRDISRLTERSIPFLRRNLGIVFQDFKIVPHWTVYENVAVSLEILGTPPRRWSASASPAAATSASSTSRAASSSASRSGARSSPSPPCCSRTSRPATSIRRWRSTS